MKSKEKAIQLLEHDASKISFRPPSCLSQAIWATRQENMMRSKYLDHLQLKEVELKESLHIDK